MPRGSLRNKALEASINITPLVDIMLTILITFIIVAPTGEHGVEVDVPKATFSPIDSKELQIVVTLTKSGELFINKKPTNIKEVGLKLSKLFERNPDKQIFFKADKGVPYGDVMTTMSVIKKAGITKIGLVTEPDE